MSCFGFYKRLPALVLLLGLVPLQSGQASEGEGWQHDVQLSSDAQDNEHVTIVEVVSGQIMHEIEAMARVEADSGRVIDIHSAGSGKVTDVHVTPGERVRTGQPLISYTDHSLHELHLQREQVLAALASARSGEAQASLLYKRGLALAGSAVSTAELERRRMLLQQQHDQVIARQADLATIDHRQTEEFTSVTEKIVQDEASDLVSPVDGVVQAVRTSVAADITGGDNLVTVVDLSRLWLIADVSPEDAAQLVPGGRAHFRPSGQREVAAVSALITTIGSLTDPQTGLVKIVCVLDHPVMSFRPGMMLDAVFETGSGIKGLLVPDAAIQRINGQDVVFMVKSKTDFTPVPIRIVERNDDNAIISGPLKVGNKIVGNGSFALKSMILLSTMAAD